MVHTPSFMELVPMVIVYTIMFISFGWLVVERMKLEKYRRSINPGDVVNYQFQDAIAFKVVVSRPGKDFLVLADMDDETRTFYAKINKIYPL